MHSRSIELAQKYGVPIYVGLSNSDIKGTVIKEVKNMDMESIPVTGIATDDDDDVAVTLQNIPKDVNILSSIFEAIGSKRINIDMISQSSPIDGVVSVSFTIPKENLKDSLKIIDKLIVDNKVIVDEDITKFSVVGLGMKTTSGVAARMFRVFSKNNIDIKMITTSEIRITCAIKTQDKLKAIQVVAKEFNL